MSEAVADAFANFLLAIKEYAKEIPGTRFVVTYLENSYQNDPFRIVLELLVFGWMLYYVLKKDDKRELESVKLTPQEVEMLVEEWEPEPLVPKLSLSSQDPTLITDDLVITGGSNLNVSLQTGEQLQNWATNNFLGIQNKPEITEASIKTVREYGVGACGPAGFYGSMDVHLELEKEIARVLDVEEAIIYSQGFMAVASVIPAFSKKGDILVADDGCSFAVQTGLEISRSVVYFFKHNDMNDLIRVLEQVEIDCKKKKMPLSRRFIVVEGLYAKHGDKCPLPKLLEIKLKYKYRLFLDESLSFGCLGPRGLGITDYFGIAPSSIDIITGALSNCLGSSGGFCAGSHAIVDHQRLSSQAYCFSAALPALFAVSSVLAIKEIESKPQLLEGMRRSIATFHSSISKKLVNDFVLLGDHDSPIRFLRLARRSKDLSHERTIINSIIKGMRQRGFLLSTTRCPPKEKFVCPPSVKICLSGGFSDKDTKSFVEALVETLHSI